MVDEPAAREPELPSSSKAKKKKNPLFLLLFVLTYVALGVGNYFHLQSTYVPPPPPPKVEEEQPILSIDLGQGEEMRAEEEDSLAVAPSLPEQLAAMENPHLDSVKRALADLNLASQTRDSLMQVLQARLEESKKPAPVVQSAKIDSADAKRSAKLAKIVENMQPEDAAKILEPLSDDMVIYILLRLKQRQAAQIMAALPPARAAALSRDIMEPVVLR